jgi:flagellar biosynthesis GTPase FlhF
MAPRHSTPPSSEDDVIVNAKHLKAPPKGKKRQRSRTAGADEGSESNGIASPEASPNKRRKKDSTSAAKGAAVEKSKAQKEKAKKKSEEAAEAEKLRKQEEKAALKAAKEKEREEKKARDAAEKKRKQEERAAVKAAKDKERAEKKQVEEEAKKKKQDEKDQKKRWKQEWESYCTAHNVDGATLDWPEDTEPESITQTDAGKLYCLKPNEMGCLRHHPKVNFKYGNTTKLFDEDEVRALAFRKYAMLAGVTGSEDVMVTEGKALWELE